MKVINAYNSALSIHLVRAATSGYKLKKCVAHPAMVCAWEMLTMSVAEIIQGQLVNSADSAIELINHGPSTIAGVPVEKPLDAPLDTISFLDAEENLVTQIVGLAIPVGFA